LNKDDNVEEEDDVSEDRWRIMYVQNRWRSRYQSSNI